MGVILHSPQPEIDGQIESGKLKGMGVHWGRARNWSDSLVASIASFHPWRYYVSVSDTIILMVCRDEDYCARPVALICDAGFASVTLAPASAVLYRSAIRH
jgi:hypothetical protein